MAFYLLKKGSNFLDRKGDDWGRTKECCVLCCVKNAELECTAPQTISFEFNLNKIPTDLPTPIWTIHTYKKSKLGWAGL